MSSQIVVSLTTSPSRIYLIEETLMSIINQNVKVDKIYVNIPPIFKRTGESYPDPKLIFKNNQQILDNVVWNTNCDDIGPITKLCGVLNIIDENDDVTIITIDDDIKYMQYTIELYKQCILRLNNKFAYGLSAFKWINGRIIAEFENSLTNVLEGYGSCCYHRSFFRNKSWNSYLNKVLENSDCKFSDDIIISNWLSLNNIHRIAVSSPVVNRKLMWAHGSILEYGNDLDALHNGAKLFKDSEVKDSEVKDSEVKDSEVKDKILKNNVTRYIDAKKYLKSIFLLCKEFDN